MNFIPQPQYDFILQNMPIACVDVCIVSEEGVLLVKRNTEPAKNQWWVPGGRVFKGEKLKDCANRKCIEEVNLHCTIGPIVHTDETVFDTGPSGISIHSINCVFICFLQNKDFKIELDEFSSDWMWINEKQDLSFLNTYVQECIKKSFIYINTHRIL